MRKMKNWCLVVVASEAVDCLGSVNFLTHFFFSWCLAIFYLVKCHGSGCLLEWPGTNCTEAIGSQRCFHAVFSAAKGGSCVSKVGVYLWQKKLTDVQCSSWATHLLVQC